MYCGQLFDNDMFGGCVWLRRTSLGLQLNRLNYFIEYQNNMGFKYKTIGYCDI